MAINTLELFERMTAGEILTSQMLEELIQDQTPEDLYLEYKHGYELKDKKKASATIRQYVSGFANSAGGTLLIGIDEATWTVTGCSAPGGGSLENWASDCLTNISAYLSPIPRIYTLKHPNGDVLVIVTARTPGLVPVKEASELVYYFRFHDQTLNNKTLKAPDYLLSDIVLGRRQRPDLYIAEFGLSNLRRTVAQDELTHYIDFMPFFRVENRGLFWAEDVRMGIISWVGQLSPLSGQASIGNQLRAYIDVREKDQSWYSGPAELAHNVISTSNKDPITPFGVVSFVLPFFSIPVWCNYNIWLAYIWKAAVYILAKNSDPVWYQVSFRVNRELLAFIPASRAAIPKETLNIEQVTGSRPIVAWNKV